MRGGRLPQAQLGSAPRAAATAPAAHPRSTAHSSTAVTAASARPFLHLPGCTRLPASLPPEPVAGGSCQRAEQRRPSPACRRGGGRRGRAGRGGEGGWAVQRPCRSTGRVCLRGCLDLAGSGLKALPTARLCRGRVCAGNSG